MRNYFVSDKGLGRFSRGQFLDWFSVRFFYTLHQKEGDQKYQALLDCKRQEFHREFPGFDRSPVADAARLFSTVGDNRYESITESGC